CTSSPAFSPQVAKVFHPADLLTVNDVRAARSLITVQGLTSTDVPPDGGSPSVWKTLR
ncbi:ABC transporter ATP-binding protein, partial [Cutibacterium granulosum DSM 20700]